MSEKNTAGESLGKEINDYLKEHPAELDSNKPLQIISIKFNTSAGESLGMEKIIEEYGNISLNNMNRFDCLSCNGEVFPFITEEYIKKSFLAGAIAHQEATRMEKEGCSRNHSPSDCTDCGFIEALTEVSTKSEEFLNGLREKNNFIYY